MQAITLAAIAALAGPDASTVPTQVHLIAIASLSLLHDPLTDYSLLNSSLSVAGRAQGLHTAFLRNIPSMAMKGGRVLGIACPV
jgi:hypothetical protein